MASADAAETQAPATGCYFSLNAPAPGLGFCSAWQGSHWGNLLIRLNLVNGSAMHVEPGDTIEVDVTVDLTPFQPMYALRASLRQRRGEKVEHTEVLNGVLEQKPAHASTWQLSS